MTVYRVTHKKYKASTLAGVGAEKVGGRWNKKGTRAVYCSENASLALLEYYVHSENIAYLPKNVLTAEITFPDDLAIEEINNLPQEWSRYPYSSKTSAIFSDFARDRNAFALRVPSTIVEVESNIILNPLYKDFGKVEVVDFIELPIDPRLRKGKREE